MNIAKRFAGAAVLAVGVSGVVLAAPSELSIMAPAGPGGGWDQTARAMQETLQAAGIVPNVQVTNTPGAGGTIGLAQFVNQSRGDATKLIVGGYVMVGAIIANQSPVGLADVTPVARLTGEYEAIVVPASSDIQTMADLVARLQADPGAVTWAGGSAGGVDHILVGLVAKAANVDPRRINYIPYSGGGEALAAILGGQVTAGVSGLGEFLSQVQAGQLRLLAVSGADRVAGVDAPTLKEAGLDVEVMNWRMVAAPPGLSDEGKADLVGTIEAMVASPQWQQTLTTRNWIDSFLAGDDFAAYLAAEVEKTTAVLKDLGIAQ